MDITSLQNPRVKHIVKLRDDKRTRKEDGLMLVEGFDEIQLAVAAGHKPQTLLRFDFTVKEADGSAQREPELVSRTISGLSAETLTVSRAVFEKISYRENPDGWLAIFPIPHTTLDDLKINDIPLIIVAESIEKPGNLGAILRTADAAHVDAVLLCDPRVDLWNPNVVRASRGAVFSVPVVEDDNASAWEWLKTRKHALSGVEAMRLLAASPSAKEVYSEVDLRGPLALAVGSEDEGLSDFWMGHADVQVKIPMLGKINSLNVSVSTAVIVYEVIRQRGMK
ncbi:MAG TPA: RNA methyltransferase [Anaerolineales bacterium]|nr:RNA methyltransferase [Anaerolineales bacterium]